MYQQPHPKTAITPHTSPITHTIPCARFSPITALPSLPLSPLHCFDQQLPPSSPPTTLNSLSCAPNSHGFHSSCSINKHTSPTLLHHTHWASPTGRRRMAGLGGSTSESEGTSVHCSQKGCCAASQSLRLQVRGISGPRKWGGRAGGGGGGGQQCTTGCGQPARCFSVHV